MAKMDWSRALNLDLAVTNLRTEAVGDWHQDPWGWPELGFLHKKEPKFVFDHADGGGSREPALIDVPKDNWGTRPAVVLDVVDRLTYQALVDRVSVQLIGEMSPNAFGWRLHAGSPASGIYSHNSKQWEGYLGHLSLLAGWNSVALRTDIVSFFASIPVDALQEAIHDRCGVSVPTRRLCSLVAGFAAVPGRGGLPQRSTASAVLANMFLAPLDDMLQHHSKPLAVLFGKKVRYHTFARWMDDMWLFGDDASTARRAQMEIQSEAQSLGLNLNYAKTEVFEGDEVAGQALAIEHSAVDDGLLVGNFQPLEELIDRVLTKPEKASRTTIKFAAQRMRESGQRYRVQDLILAANRMPHAADALSRLFKEAFTHASLQDWYLDYAASDWATHEWSVAHYGRIFASSRAPRKPLREFFAHKVRDANTSLPLLAVAAQRLAAWDAAEARSAFRDAYRRSANPHARRVLALAAAGVGETRTTLRTWLGADAENAPTLAMLETFGFTGPRVQSDFAS